MDQKEQQIILLSDAMERMMVAMKEVDDTCVTIQQDITTREFQLVSFVGRCQRVIMKEVADYMNIPLSTATGLVDKLVYKSYLKRSHSERDRRIVLIELGKKGKETYKLFQNMRREVGAQILTLLDKKETKVFIELLEKIGSGLEQAVEV